MCVDMCMRVYVCIMCVFLTTKCMCVYGRECIRNYVCMYVILAMTMYFYVYMYVSKNAYVILYVVLLGPSFSAPGSRQLMCIAYYLVLSFLLMYSSSGLSTDVFS